MEELQNQHLKEKQAAGPRQRRGSSRPRGVVVFLLMENADKVLHKDLVLSLRCLARFFWHYPVVIFHTNSTTALELNWMRSVIPGQLQVDFEEVSLDFPASLLESPGGPWTYRHTTVFLLERPCHELGSHPARPDAFLRPPSCMLDGHHQPRPCSGLHFAAVGWVSYAFVLRGGACNAAAAAVALLGDRNVGRPTGTLER